MKGWRCQETERLMTRAIITNFFRFSQQKWRRIERCIETRELMARAIVINSLFFQRGGAEVGVASLWREGVLGG